MTWEVDEEAYPYVAGRADSDPRVLIRPRRWLCAVETETETPRALCPSCYRLIQFDCAEGVWNAEFMEPCRHLQMILPFAETEGEAAS